MKPIAICIISALVLSLSGCKTHDFQPNLSQEEYQIFVKKCADIGIPAQPYKDWALFQSQNDLHQLYWQQLDINTNDTVNDHPFEVVFECWGDFAQAEQAYSTRLESAGIKPADAFKTYELSNRQRRAIGQFECKIGEHSTRDKTKSSERLQALQQSARDKLTQLGNAVEHTPYTDKLRTLALEELAESKQMWIEGNISSSLQWALDATITSESACALYEVEIRTKI